MKIYKKNRLWLAYALCLGLSMTSGCNATDPDFHIGNQNDIKLTYDLDNAELKLAADGKAQEIKVISNVKWELIKPEYPFTAVASSTEGDGIITVSSTSNFNSNTTHKSELTVIAIDFPEKFFKIALYQSQLLFQMNEIDYPEAPQEGGEVNLRFSSSIDWYFDILSGNKDWISFDPGVEGKGSWNENKVTVIWTPNYSTEERTISLQLAPSDKTWEESVASQQTQFVLIQKAGTLPEIKGLTSMGTDKTSASLSLSYESAAPIEKAELKMTNQTTDQTTTFTIPKNTGESDYPNSGTLTFTLPNLEPGTSYLLIPVVTSKVGEQAGSPLRVQTEGDINFSLPYLDEDASFLRPGITGVDAFFKIVSEIKLTSFKVALCQEDGTELATRNGKITEVLDATDTPISWIGEMTWDNDIRLSQKTNYFFKLTMTGNDPNKPNETNTISHTIIRNFTTLTRLPEVGDNHPIE